jgi:dihydrofolate reductase
MASSRGRMARSCPVSRPTLWRNSTPAASATSIDGGITVQRFLRAGLIDRLIITRVPVLIGSGIPLFGDLPRDLQLRHIATRSFPSGLAQSEYHLGEGSERYQGRFEGEGLRAEVNPHRETRN